MNLIRVKAFPNSKKALIDETAPQVLRVFVREEAEQNRANNAIMDAVATYYDLPRNKIRMISGHLKPNKLIQILE